MEAVGTPSLCKLGLMVGWMEAFDPQQGALLLECLSDSVSGEGARLAAVTDGGSHSASPRPAAGSLQSRGPTDRPE